jgi:negative regulator of sigma-B (phosphoserine phosphatase)
MEIAAAQRPATGESQCGDAYTVVQEDQTTLVAVADGLGHGPEAARAARAFCEHAESQAHRPLESILATADAALSGTRGAAVALLRLDPEGRFDFAGVGNIAVRALSRRAIHPISVAGTLGRRNARRLRCESFDVEEGDLLVVHTDGVSSRYDLGALRDDAAARIAVALLSSFGKSHDDATCVVVRWQNQEDGSSW